jgi:hypothetical protein
MISFLNINKQYGKQVLFADPSFQLNPGEKVGLVGPNGAETEDRRDAHRFPFVETRGNVPSVPVSSLLPDCRLIGTWFALHHNQKHHTDNGKHSECLFLPIPHFRLPHQKPFAPDIEECHQPHQQARRQRDHGNVHRSGEVRPVRTIRFQQPNTSRLKGKSVQLTIALV